MHKKKLVSPANTCILLIFFCFTALANSDLTNNTLSILAKKIKLAIYYAKAFSIDWDCSCNSYSCNDHYQCDLTFIDTQILNNKYKTNTKEAYNVMQDLLIISANNPNLILLEKKYKPHAIACSSILTLNSLSFK